MLLVCYSDYHRIEVDPLHLMDFWVFDLMRWAIDEDVEESDLREKMDLAFFVEKYLYLQDLGALACCYQGWPKLN